MNVINHHLTDELLMGYAAGTLPEAFSLIVATHISMCDECRARLGSFDAVGGSVLEECGSHAMAEDSFSEVLGRLDGAPNSQPIRVETETSNGANHADSFPWPLAEYVGSDPSAVKWKSLGGGVRHSVIKTSKGATARLLRIPAGMTMPDHGHNGLEATLVLKGAYRDDDGRYGPGDIEVANEEFDHTPVAEDGEDCICLTVTDAPLKFRGLVPRIAQPFLGI
ncbi:MAG: ChrR family anti-sigma-E factor [Pseudomonadota bacterium]